MHFVDEQDDVAIGAEVTSFSTAFSRSSKSPRNLAPAISEPMSSAISSFLSRRLSDQHVAIDDAQRQAFGDRGLAHARFADQHGIVLGAAGEDLDGAADLLVPPDDGIELAGAGEFGEIAGVFLECVIGVFGGGAVGEMRPLRKSAMALPRFWALTPASLRMRAAVGAAGEHRAPAACTHGGDVTVARLLRRLLGGLSRHLAQRVSGAR